MCSRTEPRIVQRKERLIEDTSPNPMNREKGRCSGGGGFSHSLLVPHRNANQPIKIYWIYLPINRRAREPCLGAAGSIAIDTFQQTSVTEMIPNHRNHEPFPSPYSIQKAVFLAGKGKV